MSKRRTKKSTSQVSPFNLEEIVKWTIQAQQATAHIPKLVHEEARKAWKQLPNTDPKNGPKSWFHDPLTLQYSLGYKDRRFSLTYDTLRRTAAQIGILNAVINTRAAQVSAFAQPYRQTKSLGFMIKHKDPDHTTTPAEVEFIRELENFVMRCGRLEKNPWAREPRDDFEGFLRKIVRDTYTFDQVTAEVIYDQTGLPFEFYAVDAATIRIAADERQAGVNSSYHERSGFVPDMPARFSNLYQGQRYGQSVGEKPVAYVQVINGQIENVYAEHELVFGVRNPRSDIYTSGYGLSEVEQLITILTSYLNAEMYNSKHFTNGSLPRGLLNFKGDNFTAEQLEGFRRQWLAQVAGVENSWHMPVMQSEGMEWVDLDKSNRDMEFSMWMEFLLRVICGVFLIDAQEIGFDLNSSSQQTPLFESNQEWKLKASRDKGLKPLLRFLAKLINKNIIDRIDDHFTLEFVGLDELSESEKHEMLVEQISSYMTLNEARRTLDLPDLPGGDIPMNPVYIKALETQGLAANPGAGGGGAPGQAGSEGGQDNSAQGSQNGQIPGPGGQSGVKPSSPKYSSLFHMKDKGKQV